MKFKTSLFYFLIVIMPLITINSAYADTNSSSPNASIITGAILNQQNIYNQSFERIDTFMSLPKDERLLMRYQNKTAFTGAGQQVFSPTFIPDEKAGFWIKSYSLFENVPLDNGPNVSNVAYGTIIGADTALKHFKNGVEGGLTFHVTYSGNRENYDNISSISNEGDIGITGVLFKKDFFTALTALVGDGFSRDTSSNGIQNYNAILAGAAWKTGYNFEFKRGKCIVQPSILATYTFEQIENYKSMTGENAHVDPIHAVQIIPGLKVIGNLEGGWQPYLGLSVIWELMDSPAIYENDVLQPRMTIGPYCEYGFGLQRKWKEKFTSFGQVMMRGGGRNGVSLYFGFRLALGK